MIQLAVSLNFVVHYKVPSFGTSHFETSRTLILIVRLRDVVNELPHRMIDLLVSGVLLISDSVDGVVSVVGVGVVNLHS